MENLLYISQLVKQGKSITLGVDDTERCTFGLHQRSHFSPVEWRIDSPFVGHSAKRTVELHCVRHDFTCGQFREIRQDVKRWLRCRRKHDGCAKAFTELPKRVEDRSQEGRRKR